MKRPLTLATGRVKSPPLRAPTILAFAALACASAHHHYDDPPIATPVDLQVINNGWLDAIVYVYHRGERFRLGYVTAHTHAILRVPAPETDDGNLQFYIHRMAERRDLLTDVVHVSDGLHPVLEIEMQLDESSLALFPDPDLDSVTTTQIGHP